MLCSLVDSAVSVFAHHGLAGQLGVGADQARAAARAGVGARPRAIACFSCASERKGRCASAASRDPGRVLVQAVEQRGGFGRRRGVESVRRRRGPWFRPCRIGMRLLPVAGDVDAAADPHAVVRCDVVQETLQRHDAARAGRAGGSACRRSSSSAVGLGRLRRRARRSCRAGSGRTASACEKPCGSAKRMSLQSSV